MNKSLRRAATVTAASLSLFAIQPALASASTRDTPPPRPAAHHAPRPDNEAVLVRGRAVFSGTSRALVTGP